MAAQTLPVFSSPVFPELVPSLFAAEIARVDEILARSELSTCQHESPESSRGACDGGDLCYELATVSEIESGLEYCRKHFEGVSRG